jgi:very-short-patch-repair endonuclease
MKVDFINISRKIAIEVNGDQHSSFNKFFHNNSRLNYLNSIKRDYKKSVWLEKNGFQLLELETSDLNKLSYDYINHTFKISLV